MAYSTEQVIDSLKYYNELCNIFFELAPDNETKEKLYNILYHGRYKDFNINSELSSKDSPSIEGQRRISYAYLLLRNPNTFNIIAENKINIFHGTNANALPSILKYGLNSIKKSNENGINVTTGEKWSRIKGTRDFISFTDILDIAEDYSTLKAENGVENLSFEVVIGTTVEDVINSGKCIISSDIPEIGVKSNLPVESIKALFVPSDKVDFVKKISSSDTLVLAADDISPKFYFIDDMGIIQIFPQQLEIFKSNLKNNKKSKQFENKEIENLMFKRLITNIKTGLENVRTILDGGRKEKHDGKRL